MENEINSHNELRKSDVGPRVQELHRMLKSLDYEINEQSETFSHETESAIKEFQEHRGLDPSGICDQKTWDLLVENSYVLGDRLLYLGRPMLRGEDIAELQRSLGSLGFDAGKVDGILGPDTQKAVELFQRNSGLVVDAIFGPNCMVALRRLGERVEQGSVAVIKEKERIITKGKSTEMPSIVLGHLGGFSAIVDGFAKKLREAHIKVAVLDHYDESMHAKFCNNNDVDLYIGIYPAVKSEKSVSFYSAKGFESPGGTYFTELFGKHFLALTGNNIKIIGHSERVLRETRMPAVVVRFGPTDELISNSQQLFETLESSVSAWFSEPFQEILA